MTEKYHFFFDESQSYKILRLINPNHLNFDNKNEFNSLIGLSIGINEKSHSQFENQFLEFESSYVKQYRGDKEEFKSTDIKREQFRYGISTLRGDTCLFYERLFDLLIEYDTIIQIICVSKMETYIREVITDYNDYIVKEEYFIYTLSKFFIKYGYDTFFDDITVDKNDALMKLVRRLMKVAYQHRNVKRLELENICFRKIASVLKRKQFNINGISECEFPTKVHSDGLIMLLNELKIPINDVTVTIDGEEGTYPSFEKFFDVYYKDSKESSMIRVADHLAGFFGRIGNAMNNDPNRIDIKNPEDQIKEYERLRTLHEKWFDIDERRFNLYKKSYELLIVKQYKYWTTLTKSFHDDISYVFCLLNYFGRIESFEDFKTKSSSQHSIDFEKFAVNNFYNDRSPPPFTDFL